MIRSSIRACEYKKKDLDIAPVYIILSQINRII